MRIKKIFLTLFVFIFSCSTFPPQFFHQDSLLWQSRGTGIRYAEIHQFQQRIFVLEVDLLAPLTVELFGKETGATVETFAREHNLDWAVNGGPYEIQEINQDVFYYPSFLWKPASGWLISDEQVLKETGAIVSKQGALIQEANGEWRIGPLKSLKGGEHQIGTGFQLLLEEGLLVAPRASRKEPRTSIGLSYEATRLYILVADGRNLISHGLTLQETALFLRNLGAWNAVNWDGGGSTTLVRRQDDQFQVVNFPCGHPLWGGQRPVATAMGIRAKE